MNRTEKAKARERLRLKKLAKAEAERGSNVLHGGSTAMSEAASESNVPANSVSPKRSSLPPEIIEKRARAESGLTQLEDAVLTVTSIVGGWKENQTRYPVDKTISQLQAMIRDRGGEATFEEKAVIAAQSLLNESSPQNKNLGMRGILVMSQINQRTNGMQQKDEHKQADLSAPKPGTTVNIDNRRVVLSLPHNERDVIEQ